jgi:ribosome biogenesis GTPase / thiamine phosphate phosphatase
MILAGLVLAQEANYYRVRLFPEGTDLLCTRRARLKKTGQSVYVGDKVEVVEVDWQSHRGAINLVEPRNSLLHKPPIANCTGVLVVFALSEPPFDPVQLSRFLVNIETEELNATVCLTKADAVCESVIQTIGQQVQSWNYTTISVSVETHIGLMELLELLGQGVYVLAGPSGAGKSSLLNALRPSLDLRTGNISDRMGRGKHTTRHVELFSIGNNILVADAPGFSQLELTCTPEALANCFPEFRPYLGTCQFRNCLHQEEPGCAVQNAHLERYAIYRTFLEEVITYTAEKQQIADPDAALKGQGQQRRTGKATTIPRLASQLRAPSRRAAKQELRQWDGEEEEQEE